MEGVRMSGRCTRSVGDGENALHWARSKSYGPSWTLGTAGKEIPVNLVYDQVMIAAKYSQEDYSLDNLIDGIDKE